jgi:hypothetical protein
MGLRRSRGEDAEQRHRHAKRVPRSSDTRRVGWIAVAGLLAIVIVAAGMVIGLRLTSYSGPEPPRAGTAMRSAHLATPRNVPQTSPPTTQIAISPTDLKESFADLTATLDGSFGVAFAAVGSTQPPTQYGEWSSGPAWSTMKVPLAIAALRAQDKAAATGPMTAAITESDNAAADTLWKGLGSPDEAADKIDAVLRETGDPTAVQSRKVRPEFSAFGQTDWSLANQVRFIAAATCDVRNGPVFDLMGRIGNDQRWGVGTIADSQFKGGWGPSEAGAYLVRQVGILHTGHGDVAVAIAAQPNSGSFAEGTTDLTKLATWLQSHTPELPTGSCPVGAGHVSDSPTPVSATTDVPVGATTAAP